MQPQMLQGIFDDSRTSAHRKSANLLSPTTNVGFSPTNKLWASATVIVRTRFCSFFFPFLSLTVRTFCFPGIHRNAFSLIKVLYGLFVTCTNSRVDYFLFCVYYSKRFCQCIRNTFLLRRAFVICFIAFPKLCWLIFAGEMLVQVPCKIFLHSHQQQWVALWCFWWTMLWFWWLFYDCTWCSSFTWCSSRLFLFCCSLHSHCLCLFDFAITWARKRHWI